MAKKFEEEGVRWQTTNQTKRARADLLTRERTKRDTSDKQ